jgi:hypothetical protein
MGLTKDEFNGMSEQEQEEMLKLDSLKGTMELYEVQDWAHGNMPAVNKLLDDTQSLVFVSLKVQITGNSVFGLSMKDEVDAGQIIGMMQAFVIRGFMLGQQSMNPNNMNGTPVKNAIKTSHGGIVAIKAN